MLKYKFLYVYNSIRYQYFFLSLWSSRLEKKMEEFVDLIYKNTLNKKENKELNHLIYKAKYIRNDINELKTMKFNANDDEFYKTIEREEILYKQDLLSMYDQILQLIIPSSQLYSTNTVLEIKAGIGGKEAMLFAGQLYNMYHNFAKFKNWICKPLSLTESELGGIRQSCTLFSGLNTYKLLRFEAGIHRVQRVPLTERSGRIHTSTAAVAIYPQPHEIEIVINSNDIKIETKQSSGAGGQHVNKTESCVRITHLPTGIVSECQNQRSQIFNRKEAMELLRAKLFKIKLDEQDTQIQSTRQNQIKNLERSDKIRTYQFNQNRVTDHRSKTSIFGVEEYLTGGELLEQNMCIVNSAYILEELEYIVAKESKQSLYL